MALKTTTFSAGDFERGSWSNGYVLRLTLVQEQLDAATKTSQVSYLLTISNTGSNRFVVSGYSWRISIGGQSIPIRDFAFDVGADRTTQTIAAGRISVRHKADGSLQLPYNVSIPDVQSQYAYGPPDLTLSGVCQLIGITVAPSLLETSNFSDEENPVIVYANPAGDAVSDLQACICNEDGTQIYAPYRDIPKTASEYTFFLTDEERTALRNATPGNSRKVKFVIRATVGGETRYLQAVRTLYIVNAMPTLSATVTDNNPETIALTGDANVLVNFFSNAVATADYGAQKGAQIQSYRVQVGSKRAYDTPYTFQGVEGGEFWFTVKDTRGNTTQLTVVKPVVEYVKLTCNIAESMPTTDGQMPFSVSGNFFSGSFGTRNNTLTVQYRYKAGSGSYCDWVTLPAVVSGDTYRAATLVTGLDYRKVYTFQARAVDALDTVTGKNYVTRALPVFDWGESDFNVNGTFGVNGVAMRDYVIAEGTKDYWQYRKWASGFMECWLHITLGAVNVANPWGALYESDEQVGYTFPFPFVLLKTCVTAASHSTEGLLVKDRGGPSETASQNYTLVSAGALGNIYNVNVRIYAAGTYT